MIAQIKEVTKSVCPEPIWVSASRMWAVLGQSRLKGLSLRLNFPDRILLEDAIFPKIANNAEYRRVLFVGCDWYTRSYPRLFRKKEFWTMEIDPSKAKYGSKLHIVDGVETIMRYFEENYFDAIIHTGVFGWGLNERRDVEVWFVGCFRCLRPGGMLVLGWDDVPEHRPFPITKECVTLQQFLPMENSPLGKAEHLVADDHLRHTFNFYTKPIPAAESLPILDDEPESNRIPWQSAPALSCAPVAEEATLVETVFAWIEPAAQMLMGIA